MAAGRTPLALTDCRAGKCAGVRGGHRPSSPFEAEDLDAGDPEDLARGYVALRRELPELHVLGGCCGTDVRHVTAISDAWLNAA